MQNRKFRPCLEGFTLEPRITLSAPGAVINEDGTSSVTGPSGVTTTYPDGSIIFQPGDAGPIVIQEPSGSIANEDGTSTVITSDGSWTTTYPNGSIAFQPGDGGATITQEPNGSIVNEDGTTTVISSNGNFTTSYPDGTITVQSSNGRATIVYPPPDPNPPTDVDDDGIPDTPPIQVEPGSAF